MTSETDKSLERAILSGLMNYPGDCGKVFERVTSDMFGIPEHVNIYDTLQRFFSDGTVINQMTVGIDVRNKGAVICDDLYFEGLLNETMSIANMDSYTDILIEDHIKRQANILMSEGIPDDFSTEDGIELIQDRLDALIEDKRYQTYSTMTDLMVITKDEITRRYENRGKVAGIPSGFKRLDFMTSGFQKGQFIVIAGRTSQGKTALALDIARNAATQGKAGAFFSLEMIKTDIGMRLVGSLMQKTMFAFEKNIYWETKDWEKLTEKCVALSGIPLYIDDTAGLNAEKFSAKVKRLIKERKIKYVIIDYLQLMDGRTGKVTQARYREVDELVRRLKVYAMMYALPIICLSQFSRSADKENRKPKLSDLRESGGIEQSADVVLMLHKMTDDEIQNEYPGNIDEFDFKNIRELLVRKNRNGPTGTMYLYWHDTYASFSDLDYK